MTVVHQAQLRPMQDLVVSRICLWDLLTDQAWHLVTSFAYAYKIDGRMSGLVLLQAIIMCTHIDTRASSKWVLCNLENLAAVMVSLDSNVETFNLYVEDKYAELCAHGLMDPTAISHLLQWYKVASDEPFVAWVK